MDFALEKYSRGRRGAPAKGVGRETGARVQIPPSPPEQPLGFFRAAVVFCKRINQALGFEPEAPGTGGGAGFDRRQWRKQGEAHTAAVGTRQGGKAAAGRVPGTARGPAKQVQIPPSPPEQPLGFFERLLFFAKESIKRGI